MEKLLKNKWLMLLIGAVVLYFVWKKFGKGEEKAGAYGSNYGLSPLYAMGKTGALRVPGCTTPKCQECTSPCNLSDDFCQHYGFDGFDAGIGNNGGCYGGSQDASFPPTRPNRVLRSR